MDLPTDIDSTAGSGLVSTDLLDSVVCGDCLHVLKRIPDRSIGAVITDPPFSSGGRQNADKRKAHAKLDGTRRTKWKKEDWVHGDSMGADSFRWFMREVALECFRVAEDAAHAYVFIDWRNVNLVTDAFESAGWQYRGLIVWHKPRIGMGSFWRNTHELIPAFTKGQPRPMPHGRFYNVIESAPPSNKEHPTEKPEKVVGQLVEATEGTVLDPFCGSGAILRAAKDRGRHYIGCDMEKRWIEVAKARLAQGSLFESNSSFT